MRVATWNCQKDAARYWGTLEGFDVDVVGVQECSEAIQAKAGEQGWSCDWRPGGAGRGIAVLARRPYAIESAEAPEVFFASAVIDGPHRFRFVCFWAMTPAFAGAEYPQQATKMIGRLPQDGLATVIAGDFNASQSPEHLANVARLEELGMVSAYHTFRGVEQLDVASRPEDFEPTSYYLWQRSRPFHMDFVFVPEAWAIDAVEVGTFETYTAAGLSDHVPFIATVTPT